MQVCIHDLDIGWLSTEFLISCVFLDHSHVTFDHKHDLCLSYKVARLWPGRMECGFCFDVCCSSSGVCCVLSVHVVCDCM